MGGTSRSRPVPLGGMTDVTPVEQAMPRWPCRRRPLGYRTTMTNPRDDDVVDQDAEPTMTAPPEDRPDGSGSLGGSSGRADDADVVDTDDAQEGEPDA